MNTQHWAWHAGRATTNAVYATKDAVTSVAGSVKQGSVQTLAILKAGAGSVKQGSVQTLAILKAGVVAAREERAKQRNKAEVK